MTLRLASGLAAGLARLIGLARGGRKLRPARQRPGSAASTASVAADAAPPSRYVVAAPLLCCLGGWSVHNRAANRVIAAGLSRGQAETLCRVLDLACDWSPTDALHREEEE